MLDSARAEPSTNIGRYVHDRDSSVTAIIRCRTYGLYSTLLASSQEIDVDQSLREDTSLRELHPYGIDLGALCDTFLKAGKALRKLEYSGLFEVGDAGPPVAIREQQQFKRVAGILEDLVRFYEFFDYSLHEKYAWAPDHLSVMLEFCQLLCYQESKANENRLSFQLAQYDFISRHLVDWPPVLADLIAKVKPNSLYAGITQSLCLFLARDYAWQASTILTEERSDECG